MEAPVELTRSLRRLWSELEDDGVVIEVDDRLRTLLLDELDYARHPPPFERRTPLYGSMIVPDDRALIRSGELVDLVDLGDQPLSAARRFADGRSTYLVRQPDGTRQLACFRRSIQYEADIVEIQADIGGYVIQRSPVLEVTRLFTPLATIEWSGHRWTTRRNARAEQARLQPKLPDVPAPLLRGMLELAIHWLSPARVGATLVLPGAHGGAGLDIDHSRNGPPLSITKRHHFAALFSSLMQSDLATVIDPSGTVSRIGVALHSSPEANEAVNHERGMRHRSAAQYTFDQPGALAVVVSEEGPVTTFYQGKALSQCTGPAHLLS